MTDAEAVSEARKILDEESAAKSAGACEQATRRERERVCRRVSVFIEDCPSVSHEGRAFIRKELVRIMEESGIDGEKSLSLKV